MLIGAGNLAKLGTKLQKTLHDPRNEQSSVRFVEGLRRRIVPILCDAIARRLRQRMFLTEVINGFRKKPTLCEFKRHYGFVEQREALRTWRCVPFVVLKRSECRLSIRELVPVLTVDSMTSFVR